jgi:hypothetical protein
VNGISNTASQLWPVRYKPREDELLSSWLARLARGQGLKVQTLCNLEFGSGRQVWNRDIDRLAPKWLLDRLCQRTGTSKEEAAQTTLREYEGVLYRTYRLSSTLPWVLTLQMYHRRWTGHGQQFCPACLAEGDVCYYRRTWRLALCTVCLRHQCLLLDRCPACQAGIAFIRTELGRTDLQELLDLHACYSCGFDLRRAPLVPPSCLDTEAAEWLMNLWRDLRSSHGNTAHLERAEVLHVICSLLTRQRSTLRLREHLCETLGAQLPFADGKRAPIETLPNTERHQLLQMAAWIVVDLSDRLRQALEARALRYNHLMRDFKNLPDSYRQAVWALRPATRMSVKPPPSARQSGLR